MTIKRTPSVIGPTDPDVARKLQANLKQAAVIANGRPTVSQSELILPSTTIRTSPTSITLNTSANNQPSDTVTVYPSSGNVYVSSIDQTIQQNIVNQTGVYSIIAGNGVSITSTGVSGTGNVTINSLTSGNTGNITFSGTTMTGPAGSSDSYSIYIQPSADFTNALQIYPTADNDIHLFEASGNAITLGNYGDSQISVWGPNSPNANITLQSNGNTWNFGEDGTLTLPANAFSVNYANGTQVPLGTPAGSSGAAQFNWQGNFSNQGGTPGDTYSTLQFDSNGMPTLNGTNAYQQRVDNSPYMQILAPRVESTDFGIVAGPGLTVVGYDDTYNTPRSAYLSVQDQSNATQQWDFGIFGNGDNNFVVSDRTNSNQWAFGTDGNLTVPAGILGAGNLKLSPDSTNANAYLDIYLTGGPDIHIAGNGESIILGTDAYANVMVNVNGNVYIQAGNAGGTKTWNFDTSGNLALPNGGIIYETNIPGGVLTGNTIVLKPQGGINSDQQLLVYPTAIGSDFNHLHLTSGNLYNTELFLGSDDLYVKLANTGNVIINSNDGTGNSGQWNFDYTGNLTLPANAFAINYANGSQVALSSIANGNSNVNIPAANGNVNISAVGNTTMVVTGTGANITGNLTVSGNILSNYTFSQSGNTSAYATKRILQYVPGTGAVTYSNDIDASSIYITGYAIEIHVSPSALNDTGNGTIGTPVKTIARAKALLAEAFETSSAGQRKTIVLHPGDYVENVTIDTQYTVLTTHELVGKNTTLSGTLTVTTGCTIDGLKMNNLVISATSATGSVDLIGCTVTGAVTKTSSAYTNFRGCDLSSATLNITGTGTTVLVGGNYFTLTVNNAAAGVLAKAVVSMGPVTLTAGTLQLSDTLVYAAANTANAITQSAGSVLTLNNTQTLIPDLTNVARNSFGGFYSIINAIYDKVNSTFGGTSLNSIVYSQYINSDTLTTTGNANVGNLGTTTAIITTGNITTINSGLLQNGNSNITITSNGNISLSAVGSPDEVIITATGVNVAGTLNANGNANVGNLGTAQVLATANITAPQLISNIATSTAPLVVTSTTRVANLNVDYANVADFITVAAGTGNNFLIFANAATGNISELTSTGLTANLSANSITATTFIGALANGNSNVNIATANGNVTIAAVGNTTMTVTGTGANITGTLNVTGNITGNTAGFAIGYLNIPQVAASNTTIALTDAGKHYYSTSAGNFTLTVPNNTTTSFATGTAISIVVQSAGNVLVNAASGVTLYMAGNSTAANRVVSNYGMATLMKVATDTWMINGTGVA